MRAIFSKRDYFNIEKDFITVECIGVDDEIVKNLVSGVYEGEIDIDKISSGEEVILIVPQKYGIIYGDDGSTSRHQNLVEGLQYDKIYENDIFHAGDEIEFTLLYTDEPSDSSIESYAEKSLYNVGRIDNTVKSVL